MPPASVPFAGNFERIFFRWVFPLTLAAIFIVYASFRQRYIGAADWYGYYQQAELLKQGRVALPTELPAGEYPALVPFGYFTAHGRALPQYTPGFPLLLAAGSLAGLTFFVTPLIGLISCVLMFFLLRDLTDRRIAALFPLVWAFLPIVTFGATTLMSDLVAATCLIGAYHAYRRGLLFVSALVLGYSFSVRPTNVLFLLLLLPSLWRDRAMVRYALYLAMPVVMYALYNHVVYGRPWITGYGNFRTDLKAAIFPGHFVFYARQTWIQCTPVVLVLAVWGLRPWQREKLLYLLWFAAFLVFYSFWVSGGEGRWWWSRFILPGLAPLFLLAAIGFSHARDLISERLPSPFARRFAVTALFAVVAALPFYEVRFGLRQNDLWKREKTSEYPEVVRRVAELVPPRSFVGSIEFGGSFRVYSQLTPFVSAYDSAPRLVEEALRQKRAVYLVVEPMNHEHKEIRNLLRLFPAEKIIDLPIWTTLGPMTLYRLHSPAVPPGP